MGETEHWFIFSERELFALSAKEKEQHATASLYLVGRLRPQGDEIPEHVRVLEVGPRVPLLRVDEVGELEQERQRIEQLESAECIN